ncbi:FAD-dependent monooxygenase sdcF [Cladobotryum mycophilum]|uniref:FAD-dependent monooxygenase sdcF n=1 Tax=Cladobotryum mycophilum TaxID=491253 RepID=A0ABR0SCA1_9HYPO
MYQSVLYALVAALPAVTFAAGTAPCKLIDSKIPGRISYPDSATYNSSVSSYYSGQERALHPGCIFRPTNTAEVSQFIKLVTANNGTQFAVRGGGHTLWTGAANVDNGITVDMRAMKDVTLSNDKKIARLGPGGIFSDIYPKLVPQNLTVMGGRVPGIGVGGFVTGGGITFLSRKNGFSCDNIYGYEVVLASGEVVYATQSSHPDLWLALKGGSNNFGIVTRFDVAAFPLDKMWYSLLKYKYADSMLQAQANAFSKFMDPANFDSDAMMGIFLDYAGGAFSVSDAMWYTKNVAKPAVYKPFTDIPNLGGVAEVTTVDKVVEEFGGDIPATSGRAFQLTFSFQNPNASVYMNLFKIWEQGISKIAKVDGIFIEFLTQPQPVTNGTNLFGLKAGKTDNVLIDMTATYTKASDDAVVKATLSDIVQKQRALLKSTGHLLDFIYLNYADISQDVLGSWGAGNLAKLKAASKKYDPQGVFQKRVPGGYKLFK